MPEIPSYDELKQRVEALEQTLEVRDGVRPYGLSAGDLQVNEILDIPLFRSLLESLYGATGIPSAILDADENILIAVGWQEICTRFHRVHPECAKRCKQSDSYIKSHLSETGFVEYQCANGLWDFAFPIQIDGRHVATFFFGQVFLEDAPVDRSFFREQARTFGFDEKAYMAALDRAPVISRDRLNHTLAFSEKLARLAVAMGTKTLSQVRSIDRQNRAQEEIRRSEAKFRSLFDQAGDAIFIHDADGRFVDVNQKACGHTGYDREELLALGVKDIDPDADVRGGRNGFWRQFSRHGRMAFETRHMRKDGSVCPVEVSLSPIAFGGAEYILAIARDITDRKRLEDQLRQAQKMEAIGTLAGGIAHDFNNILAPIIGYSEMTANELPEDSPLRRNLVKVLDSAQRARDLVQQILTFSRKFEKSLEPVRIRPIVKEALKLMRATIPTTIDIREDIADTGAIRADLTQIHQIVINLCTNAYHAMWHTGGVLRVALTETGVESGPGAIHPDAKTGRYARLTVADAGSGIDPSILENIFEPYFTTKEEGKGTGLGLSVVDGIVREHGGFITLDNHPGQGCAFHVFFPLISGESKPSEPLDVRDCPTGSERVLLVEDERPLLEMIQRMLEGLGYGVTSAEDGDAALAIFQSQPDGFDLVLTDMTMPRMTGDRLALEIQSVRPDVPILICTGYSDKIDKKRSRELGLSGFLLKPIFRNDLAVAVRNALDSRLTGKDT